MHAALAASDAHPPPSLIAYVQDVGSVYNGGGGYQAYLGTYASKKNTFYYTYRNTQLHYIVFDISDWSPSLMFFFSHCKIVTLSFKMPQYIKTKTASVLVSLEYIYSLHLQYHHTDFK